MAEDSSRPRQPARAGTQEVGAATQPLVSVIVPHYNDLDNLDACLMFLAAQTLPRGQFEIIVADNNSTCGLAVVQVICGDRAKVVPAHLQGAAEARNAGVVASRGKYLAFIDSDCRPSRDWLERGIAALATAEMVGGRVDVSVADRSRLTAVEAFEMVFAFDFERYIKNENFSGTGNMFIPRRIFETVGGFRSGVSEDKDWGQRAAASGFHWTYAPGVIVSHPARRNWGGLQRKWRRLTREAYLLTKERPFGRVRWMLRAWLVLLSPFAHSVRILLTPKLDHFGDRLKAIGILFRIRLWRFFESYRVLTES